MATVTAKTPATRRRPLPAQPKNGHNGNGHNGNGHKAHTPAKRKIAEAKPRGGAFPQPLGGLTRRCDSCGNPRPARSACV